MPFADDRGLIPRVLEALRHEPFGGVQPIVGRGGNHDRLQSITERISPGHQRRSCGRAHRLRVKLRELRAAALRTNAPTDSKAANSRAPTQNLISLSA